MLSKKTLGFLHRTYNSVIENQKSQNLIDLLLELQSQLIDYEVPTVDMDEFDDLLRNIETSILTRKKTFAITTFVSNIVLTLMYITIYANECQNIDIDINWLVRRKSLESELTKMLLKSVIHDRFGIRGIVLNKDSEDDSIETKKLIKLSKFVETILTQSKLRKRNLYSDFLKWVQENPKISEIDKSIIIYILKIPFKVIGKKDYISDPKENHYQSLHLIIQVEMFSEHFPGAEFEMQYRTYRMHQHAENGASSHEKYKKQTIAEDIKKVFKIDDLKKANVIGFTSYNSSEDDIDGLHTAKIVCSRRVSKSLIQF